MRYNRDLNKILIAVLVGYIFYYRGFDLGVFSSGVMIPLLSVIVFLQLFVDDRLGYINHRLLMSIAILLFYTLSVSLLYSEHAVNIFIFSSEVVLSFIVYYVGYAVYQIYGMEFVAKSIIYPSILIFVIVVFIFIDNDNIRRIGAGDRGTGLNIGVNHLAQSLAILFISTFYLYKIKGSFVIMLYSVGTFFIALLPVSRASILGILFSVGYYYRSKTILVASFAIIVFSVIWVFDKSMLLENFILGRLFSVNSIVIAIDSRLEVISDVVINIDSLNLLTGQPWRYGPINSSNGIMYPHNIVLSILLHMGIVFAIIFVCYVIFIFIQLFMDVRFNIEKIYLLSILTVTVFYSSTSGRLTRILVIFYVLGVAQSYIHRERYGSSCL